MADNPMEPHPADDLQFHTVEKAFESAQGGQHCAACGKAIVSTYYTVGELIICPACSAMATAPPAGSRLGRLTKAALFGLGAGLLGALIWFAVRRAAHLEIGLIAILVGFMVGKAVRRGSGNRGGLTYQFMAVVITYCCIAANYMPDILEMVFQDARQKQAAVAEANVPGKARAEAEAKGDPVAEQPAEAPHAQQDRPMGIGQLIASVFILLVLVFAFSLAAPFLAGAQNLIGLLIIGFALWEAWKFNAWRPLPISGPYHIKPETASM